MMMEQTRQEIKELVEKYNKLVEAKRVKSYNEEMTKKDFILPLFRALGWKVEDSNEVSAEEKISKGRVDYSFRINGIPKFFLEAKALREDLDNPKFIEQAINNPPTLSAIGNKLVNEDSLLEFTISATDADGDNLTYSAVNLPSGANFNATGRKFSWKPDLTQAGNYSATFIANDGKGGSDSEAINILLLWMSLSQQI